ncbi:MAG TPA: LytR C-terminal domain-containing protein [Longimicrobiales bacterium]|nr:LytR C-terminal domain-containing protein [Longimicrobiales bacterium]
MGARLRGLIVLVVVLLTGAVLGTAGAQWLAAGPEGSVEVRPPTIPGGEAERVRVEVLNGSGLEGLARVTTGYLRDRGFDVVEVGNWETFEEDSTFVLARTADLEVAERVAAALGGVRVLERPEPNLYVDVSVVLGKDWSPDRHMSPDQPAVDVPWWDLRQYLKRPGPPPPGARLADPDPGEGRT